MAHAQTVSLSDFEDQVIKSSLPVIVDFYADWCAPCRMMSPVLDRVSQSFMGRAKIVKVNVEQDPELAAHFNISSIPTLVFVQNGQIVGQHTGVASERALENTLENIIRSK